ncbi:hypothetical protein [Marinomonas ostreistagni]|uniref:hypothetical protein n=1 Tax=Marinomonas ostreistagni TaxID=359209 RepID=UPI001950033E|nr:hypothetical protein [Marinomonas ostreistagni]MBM6550312.1 hypothetical protein [Marinomonas ostreistagni]
MNIEKLISTTQPGLYESSGEYKEYYPYIFAGTCFAIRSHGRTYIVTAKHCSVNCELSPLDLLYAKHETSDEFFGYDQSSTINAPDSQKYADLIALRISEDESRIALKLPCLDLTNPYLCIDLSTEDINDVIIRGYPYINPNYSIDYDSGKIKYSGYRTNKMTHVRKGSLEHCTYIKMETPIHPELTSPNKKINANGMSGSPVYALDKNNNIRFAGTIIGYNDMTDEYLIVNSYIIKEFLHKSA